MARKYANVLTAIWRDADFRALPGSAQRTYMMLFSQPDITAVGLLAMTVGRWANYAVDTKPDDLRDDFEVLERARFIVVDTDTEELLVRTFVVWDGGANNPKRQPVIRAAAEMIASNRIRVALCGVLDRLDLPERFRPDWYADSLSARLSDRPSNAYPVVDSGSVEELPEEHGSDLDCDGGHEDDGLESTQADSLSARQCRLDRVVVTEVSKETTTHNPETTTHNPRTRAGSARTRSSRNRVLVAEDDPGFVAFWGIYPRRDSKLSAREAWPKALARAGGDAAVINDGAARYRDWPGRDEQFPKMPATWLNNECWNDELAARRATRTGNGYQPYRDTDRTRADYLGDL